MSIYRATKFRRRRIEKKHEARFRRAVRILKKNARGDVGLAFLVVTHRPAHLIRIDVGVTRL